MTYFNRLLLSRGASTAVLISNRKSRVGQPANPRSSCIGRVVKKTIHPTNRRRVRGICIRRENDRRTATVREITVTSMMHTYTTTVPLFFGIRTADGQTGALLIHALVRNKQFVCMCARARARSRGYNRCFVIRLRDFYPDLG